MTHEPLRVEPVEVEYYQDKESAVARIVWYLTLMAILYGAFNVLAVGTQLFATVMGEASWGYLGAWQTLLVLVHGALAILLLVSGIGCLTHRPGARKGVLVYAYAMIAVQTLSMGAYVMMTVRNQAMMGPGSSVLEMMMIAISYVWWMAQGCVFPIVSILLFRMKEVERLFVR